MTDRTALSICEANAKAAAERKADYVRRAMKDEAAWRAAILETDLAWADCFKNERPIMTGDNPSDYL